MLKTSYSFYKKSINLLKTIKIFSKKREYRKYIYIDRYYKRNFLNINSKFNLKIKILAKYYNL